ncbi:TIGR03546 family protein [candidate division KSB1 bacterium]|nr:TIGR03546 family protein [candidate division KSB1 bacterium]
MFWLKIISNFIKAFRSGEKPWQIAAGFGVGFIIGLLPSLTLQGVLLFCLLIFFNINMAAGTLGLILSNIIAYPLDPIFHDIGFFILTGIPALENIWTSLYNMPIAPLTKFNNTVVMGSFVAGLILYWPVFWGMKKLVVLYRSGMEQRINKLKIVQIIKGSKLVQLYFKIRDLGGK